MAEKSAIAWTRSTFNPWIGCTKVSLGCDHCYASVSTPARTMGIQWGAGQARRRTSPANWKLPLRWNEAAPHTTFAGRKGFWPVFCSSLADVFDNEVPTEWRRDLFNLIAATPYLTWLLLTKRIGNAKTMMADALHLNQGANRDGMIWPLPNVWLGATIVNQAEADRDIPKLLATPAAKRFVSYEPALGPVDFEAYVAECKDIRWCAKCGFFTNCMQHFCDNDGTRLGPPPRLDWIIVGGESDQASMKARPFDIEWARSTVRQCKAAGVPVFVKQLGSHVGWNGFQSPDEHWPNYTPPVRTDTGHGYWRCFLKDRAGADPSEWPEDLRVQEFPS